MARQHGLERRSDMLAAAIKARVATVANAITPPGGRPPFTRKMSVRETFNWWLKHRYDAIGMAEYGKMTAIQQQELDAWLMGATQAVAGQPKEEPTPLPTPNSVLSPAMSAERRLEGPPPSAVVS